MPYILYLVNMLNRKTELLPSLSFPSIRTCDLKKGETVRELLVIRLTQMVLSYDNRSNSLPSAPHPIASQLEEHLCIVRSNSAAASISSSSISQRISCLRDLHDCVGELLLLPSAKQSIAHEGRVDSLLDGSLRLLDACNVVKEALLQTKDSAQRIQSAMRRRCGARSEVKKFLSTRRVVKKAINKALKNLKGMGSNKRSSRRDIVDVLGEAQAHTLLALESMLSFINGRKTSSWCLVSKFMRSRRVGCGGEEENEFAFADALPRSLVGKAEDVKNQLQKLELCVQDFEEGLELLFRRLIKTRVSLLNLINH